MSLLEAPYLFQPLTGEVVHLPEVRHLGLESLDSRMPVFQKIEEAGRASETGTNLRSS